MVEPAPAPGTPDAVVEISEFRVYPDFGFDYAADLTVRETGGKSGAVIVATELTLVDLGPSAGRVPWTTSAVLPAGGSVVLLSSATDSYGNAQFSFGGSQPSSRVSVTIHFRDDAGRAGSVTAVTSVTDR